mgnify:CR=1 FL=1
MPYKPKRPCAYPGCGRLAVRNLCGGNEQYCAEHQKVMDKQYNQYERDPASNKRYGRSWKRIRDRFIRAHPLCEECKKQGKLMPADEVHHVLPLSRGGTNAEDNLMALCHSCHARITVEMGDRWHAR